MATLADRIVVRLREAGVRHLFGVPGGGGNLDLIDAGRRAGLRFVLTATETAAAIAAIAEAEVAQAPGACLTTLGPGAAAAANGVACAFLDRAPVVVFTDRQPASADRYIHQRIDQRALFSPITKSSETLTSEDALVTALALATMEPPGPVHLDCAGDFDEVEIHTGAARRGSRITSHPPPDPAAPIDVNALERLRAARRPVLVVGLGARRVRDAEAVRRLSERRGVPALVTYKAKGVVPDGHPWFAGVFTNGLIEQPLVREADLILGVGLDPVELIPKPWPYAAPVVSCARSRMDDRHVPFAAQLVGDLPEILDAVADRLPDATWDQPTVHARVAAARARAFAAHAGFSGDRAIAVAARRLADRARATVDAGAHMFPATLLWPAPAPNELLISNGLSTMGFALPAAIGAALAEPARPVVAVTGDGGLMMCVSEIATAVRERLRIITLVLADARLSLIDIKQQRRRLRDDGVALGGACWATIAEGFGAAGFAASSEAELDRAIDGALAHDGPSVIEAKIDPSNYGAVLEAVRG